MPVPELILHVMSGTGNTLRVARWIADDAAAGGARVEIRPIAQGVPVGDAGGPGAMTGVLFPTHGFTLPWAALARLWKLPRGGGRPAFALATAAATRAFGRTLPGLEGTATLVAAVMLWAKGYTVRGLAGVDMPVNWTLVVWGMRPENNAAVIADAKPKVARFWAALAAGHRRFGRPLSWLVGLLLAQVSLLYLIMGRFLLAKTFMPSDACDGCGLCVAHCPHGGVVWRTALGRAPGPGEPRAAGWRPYWNYRCESCMRCMAYCPRAAVETPWAWLALLVACWVPPMGLRALEALAPGWSGLESVRGGWGLFLVNYPYRLAAGLAAYWAMWQALRLRPLAWLWVRIGPSHWWRRYHEPGTGSADLMAGRK